MNADTKLETLKKINELFEELEQTTADDKLLADLFVIHLNLNDVVFKL